MSSRLSSRPAYRLPALAPLAQLRAGRLGRRIPQLLAGLILYGWSMAMMIKSGLGLDPWDVFHQGLSRLLPMSFGAVTMLVGAVVLLAWIPLRQWPGIGTISNVVVIGLAADAGLWLLPAPETWAGRVAMLLSAIVLNGLAGAGYIGTHLGPGPRDGLMTGLAARTGGSLRLIRIGIELSVLVLGFALGGVVGVGTVLYALAIGPLVQFFLPLVAVRLPLEPDDARI
ncbi:MAG TPA: hypothetical protein VFP34_16980 [Microlunatus sp.]|nr:hypothetical protein [Microlunatus sp.]